MSIDEIKHVEEVSRAIHEVYGMIMKQLNHNSHRQSGETVHANSDSQAVVAS